MDDETDGKPILVMNPGPEREPRILVTDRHLSCAEVDAIREEFRRAYTGPHPRPVVILPNGVREEPRGTTPQVVGMLCLLSAAFGAITTWLFAYLLLAGR